MEHDYKKIYQLIGWLLLVIMVCFCADLIIISGGTRVSVAGSSVQAAGQTAKNEAITEQERSMLGETLSDLLLCGQWPIAGTGLSDGRGNPFEPKKQPLSLNFFMAPLSGEPEQSPAKTCLTVREALNK